MLAILALTRGHRLARDRLAGMLWPDRGEPQARASLRQCLVEIRTVTSAHGELVASDREVVALLPHFHTVIADLDDDTRLADVLGEIGSEPLLSGLELNEIFDDWATATRAAVEARLEQAVHREVGQLAVAEDWEGVVHLANLWAVRDPLDERIAAEAIRAERALGRTAAAERRLRSIDAALRREGLAPTSPSVAAMPPAAIAVRPAPSGDQPPPMVVLPFACASDVSPYLGEALRHEIISGLARYRDLRLLTDAPGGVPDNGYTLVASLSTAGTAVTLSAQLRRGGGGHVVWAQRYQLPLSELQATVDGMVGRVVIAVLPAVQTDLAATLQSRTDHGVYDRYLSARFRSHRPATYLEARAAATDLEAIIAEDPNFPAPMLALARLYNIDFAETRAGSSGPAERARAMELTKRALVLDKDNVAAWNHVGWCHLRHGNWDAARHHFESALTLNSFHADRLLETAWGILYLGDLDRTGELLDQVAGMLLRPTDDYWSDAGLYHLFREDHGAAAACFEMVGDPDVHMLLHNAATRALGGLGHDAAARQARQAVDQIHVDGRWPDCGALIAWVDQRYPLRDPAARELLLAGLVKALGPTFA